MWTLVLYALLVAAAGGAPRLDNAPEGRLPAPMPTEVYTFFPPGKIIIKWPRVNGSEPVLGYKVRLWEAKGMKVYTHTGPINGASILKEVTRMPELIDFKAEDGKLYEYLLTGPDHSELTIHGIKLATPYLYEVLAFSASGDGQPSGRSGFQLDVPDKKEKEDTK